MTNSSLSFTRGFFLPGFLFALLGAALPVWNYHLTDQHARAGWLFFALGASALATAVFYRRGTHTVATPRSIRVGASLVAALALLTLAAVQGGVVRFAIQFGMWSALGAAGGLLTVSLLGTLGMREFATQDGPALAANQAGIFFGAGCVTAVLSLAAAFNWGFALQMPAVLAAVPLLFGLRSMRSTMPQPSNAGHPSPRHSLAGEIPTNLPRFAAVPLVLLLFVHSASEWTLAGWLPVFLTHRVGISPVGALVMLALYWTALLAGRLANRLLLSRLRHSRLLIASVAAGLLGSLLLVSTDNVLGATAAILLLGAGSSSIYPLVYQNMGRRPILLSGPGDYLFLFAIMTGMLGPWLAGLLAGEFGLRFVMLIPVFGSLLAACLLLVLWLGRKVTGQ